MKRISIHPTPRFAPGFTLVELLVSITILALILVLTAQLVNSASTTITGSNKRTDADSQSRLVFSRLGQDIARMVKRTDVDFSTFKQPAYIDTTNPANNVSKNLQDGSESPALDHNDRLAFYSETIGGYSGGFPSSFPALTARAPLSLLAYQVAAEPNGGATTLRRMAKALGWDASSTWACPVYLPLRLTSLQVNGNPINLFSTAPTNPNPSPAADPDYSTIGDMVFRFEYSYLLKANPTNVTTPAARLSTVFYDTGGTPKHTPAIGFQDVAAIVVTLGILDTTSRVVTSKDATQVTKLISAFPDAVDGQDTLKTWQSVVFDPNFAANAGIPRPAASAVRLYQRTFYLEQK